MRQINSPSSDWYEAPMYEEDEDDDFYWAFCPEFGPEAYGFAEDN